MFGTERPFTFEELQLQYDLPTGQFIAHAALTNAIRANCSPLAPVPETDTTLQIMLTWSSRRHRITNIYKAITKPRLPLHPRVREKWAFDLQLELHDGDWDKILNYIPRVSRNARFRFLQFNFMHRTYLTPTRLHRIFPTVSSECPPAPRMRSTFTIWSGPADRFSLSGRLCVSISLRSLGEGIC